LSQLLGENDRRVKILRAMHAEANAIIEGSQAPDVV
jgi:deoxycytidylate deaminase